MAVESSKESQVLKVAARSTAYLVEDRYLGQLMIVRIEPSTIGLTDVPIPGGAPMPGAFCPEKPPNEGGRAYEEPPVRFISPFSTSYLSNIVQL